MNETSEYVIARDGLPDLKFWGVLRQTERSAVSIFEGFLHQTNEFEPLPTEPQIVRRTFETTVGTFVGQIEWAKSACFPYGPAFGSLAMESADLFEIGRFFDEARRPRRAFHLPAEKKP